MPRVSPRLASALALIPAVAHAQWSADPAANLAVADRSGEQVQPKISPTPDGGCYIAWFDNATGGYDVYLQRLDAAGVEQWAHNGLLIADRSVSSTVDYDLITDGDGNAVLTFNDDAVVPGTQQVVVHRISPAGTFLWGPSGVTVSEGSGFKANPHVAALTDGSFAVAYFADGAIVLQRLSETGAPQWSGVGVTITESGHAFNGVGDLHAAPGGAVIVSWIRARTTSALSNKSIYAQKFDASGAPLWSGAGASTGAGDPVIVFDAGTTTGIQNGYFPTFLPDGDGGAVFAWYETGAPRHAYLQHILSDGTPKFPAPIPSTGDTPGRIRLGAALAFDAATGEYFIASPEGPELTTIADALVVQKFSPTGARLWTDAGTALLSASAANNPSFVQCLPVAGGCMAFAINPSGSASVLIAGRIHASGTVEWTTPASSAPDTRSRLAAAASTKGFAMLAWSQGASAADVLAQNVNPDGTLGPASCYPNCDGSTIAPVLNVNDFICFQTRFAAGDPYANCDGSTVPPVLNVNDFICFQTAFAAGCP